MADMVRSEDERTARLLEAQGMAAELFAAVEAGGLIAPGVGERQASDAIRDLAGDMFGTERWWHKRIVRAGPNTLQPYRENPPGCAATGSSRCTWWTSAGRSAASTRNSSTSARTARPSARRRLLGPRPHGPPGHRVFRAERS
jgi:hypothetical protein